MGRTFLCATCLVGVGLLFAPDPVHAQEAGVAEAMRRLADADAAMHAGRPAAAFQGYLAVVKRFPTWWIPTVKAGVAANALRMPEASVDAWFARSATQEPSGDFLPLISLLLALDREQDGASANLKVADSNETVTSDTPADPASTRLSLARGMAFERDGRVGAAVIEYRGLLARAPSHQAARFRLAGLLASIGRRDEALALFREGEARSLNPARWRAAARKATSAAARTPGLACGEDCGGTGSGR